jgi:DNA invertase Pin-like site-specific DNA recombinase
MISKRTKDALAAAKRRGKTLGGDRGVVPSAKVRAKGQAAIQKRVSSRVADLAPEIEKLRASGLTSLRAIAAALNERGIETPRGVGEWQAAQVARVLERL